MAWKLTVAAFLVLTATALAGPIAGTEGPDALSGTSGDDFLAGGPGADAMAGGRGEDACATDALDPMPTGCEEVTGTFGCEGDGELAVTIAGEAATAPVDC